MATAMYKPDELVSAPPVFFLNKDAPENATVVECCEAAESLTGFGSIVGCQGWEEYGGCMELI